MSFYEEEKSKGNTLKAPQKLHDQLDELASWTEGWNSYDALPISPQAIAHAHQWVERYLPCGLERDIPDDYPYTEWSLPSVTGSGDGDVVLWWTTQSKDPACHAAKRLTVYIEAGGDISYVRCENQVITDSVEPIGYDTWVLLWYWLFS